MGLLLTKYETTIALSLKNNTIKSVKHKHYHYYFDFKANKKLENALMWAAIDGNLINSKWSMKTSKLVSIYFCLFSYSVGFEDIVNLLIERGADIERRNKKNESALMWAAVSGIK